MRFSYVSPFRQLGALSASVIGANQEEINRLIARLRNVRRRYWQEFDRTASNSLENRYYAAISKERRNGSCG